MNNAITPPLEVAGRWRRKAAEAVREGNEARRADCIRSARFALWVASIQRAPVLP